MARQPSPLPKKLEFLPDMPEKIPFGNVRRPPHPKTALVCLRLLQLDLIFAQQSPERFERFDIVTYRFESGGNRNCQDQAHCAPK